jgi:hypothetical protein
MEREVRNRVFQVADRGRLRTGQILNAELVYHKEKSGFFDTVGGVK